ncbi:hypothetical protein CVD19_17265 [Bacillus sp. T33-2]|nr:hypothetical protein CVD19_17265 [Bacillus sp. T33-2]
MVLSETNSFSRTAELLNVSQTTVTSRIKQLENHIGKKLFIRDTRHVQLSEAGTVLYPFAKKGVNMLKQGEFTARSYINHDEKIEIGSLVSLWHYFLLPYVHSFRHQNPDYICGYTQVRQKVH